MDWKETLMVVGGIALIVQFFHWLLKELGIQERMGIEVIIFVSANFALSMIILLIVIQLQRRVEKIEGYLYKEKIISKSEEVKMNKAGYIDARILWIPIAVLILYLLYRAFLV